MIKRVNFLNMSPEEWTEQRRKTIGGSDAGTIVGLNKYDSPYHLWCVKTGRIVPEDISDKESVRLGHDLEQYVADRFTEATGKKLRRDNNFVYNTEIPFAHVQADRLVVNESAGFEAKTSSSYEVIEMLRDGKYRDSWYVQCVHGMMVTGFERWYLGVLVFGHGFYWFVIERDEAEIDALRNAEADFWKLVETDTPPAVDGTQATTEALKTIYADSDDSICDLTAYGENLRQYIEAKKQIKELEAIAEEAANKIKVFMGDSGGGECEGFKVSWKAQSRSVFDRKRFESENPDIDLSGYYKETNARIFRVSEIKK